MTASTTLLTAVVGTGLAAAVTEAVGAEPWWIAAIVVPLAGFAAWLVKWILDQQKERDKATATREEKREAREEKRAEQAEMQTRALQECVIELRTLTDQQRQQRETLAAVPGRVVEEMVEQGLVAKRTA